jgi:hypothetical protein
MACPNPEIMILMRIPELGKPIPYKIALLICSAEGWQQERKGYFGVSKNAFTDGFLGGVPVKGVYLAFFLLLLETLISLEILIF